MSLESDRIRLLRMKERYFRPVIAHRDGHLVHFGDCDIYRSVEVYGSAWCTCGFLCDIQDLSEPLREKVYANFHEELARQDGPPATPEQIEERIKFLEVQFPGVDWRTKTPPQDGYDQEWDLIEEVFGENFRERKAEEFLELKRRKFGVPK